MEKIPARIPLTVVVLTMNEERNLEECLASLAELATKVFVVDSGSTDSTVEIASRRGAQVVTHAFEGHAKQWNWAVRNLPIQSEWILALDADHRLTPELRSAMIYWPRSYLTNLNGPVPTGARLVGFWRISPLS